MSDTQNTLRDALEASFNAAEETSNKPVIETPDPVETQDLAPDSTQASEDQAKADRERDEKGRFAAKQAEEAIKPEQTPDPKQTAQQPQQETQQDASIAPPSTWKKEYRPAWEKMARGEPLTADESKKLAQYNVQREREFATGVSTYRAEAQNAKHLTDALAPFMPTIQSRGLSQAQFVHELGKTYHFLVNGQPQEKMQALAQLAQNVGIPLQAVAQAQGGQLDPVVPQLMQYIQQLEGKVNNVASWREQQEQAAVQNEIARFQDSEKYPHFQAVRTTMGQLIERGMAKDSESAYHMAVRLNDEAWEAEQARRMQGAAQTTTQAPQIDRAAQAAQAKERAISPRPAAPTGTPKTVNPKDIRSALEAAWDSHTGTGRV
jgi:hypothetical protein